MKKYKKIRFWLSFCLFIIFSLMFFGVFKGEAKAISGEEAILVGNCVNGALTDHYSDDLCKFMTVSSIPSECSSQQQYGKGEFEPARAAAAKYLLSYRAEGYNDANNPPRTITIRGEDDKPISGGTVPGPNLEPIPAGSQYSIFSYNGQSFHPPGEEEVSYWVYTSSYDPKYPIALLIKDAVGEPPVIAAMVNLGGNSKGEQSPVCAYKLNKAALISTPTGGVPNAATPTNTESDEEACYGFNWSLSWVACPVINAAEKLAATLFDFVEDQLQFRVEDGDKKDSLGDKKTREEVKSAWNNFRILVSGLVVILMLVMVISQAIGSGPFDAYTIRKMLPRLVAGVILIQLSWPIFSWVINFVDDLGRGLADIMFAPFGGSSSMELGDLLKDSQGQAIGFSWVAFLGTIVAGVVVPFLVLGLILTVLVAIFAGFLALLFRKILIILALILVPVALIAWMMPSEGLRRYWKLWWDNFLKALMMFPLIILIIAGGRIFAKIGGGQSDLVGFFIVLVGFFGPLFILPKTFKWGGTVMTMAGNALTKAQAATMKKPQEYLKKQQEGYSALRDARSSYRYNNPNEYRKNAWARTASLWRRPIDTFKAGGLNPLLGLPGSELRARQRTAFVARGDKYDTEERQEGAILLQKVEDRLHEGRVVGGVEGGMKDDMLQDMLRIQRGLAPLERYFDTSGREMNIAALMGRGSRARRVMRRAAEDRMVQLGADTNWSHIDAEHERIMGEGSTASAEERTRWRKFLNDNKDTVLEKMPDLLKGVGSVSDINADGIARMHGAGIKRMISQLDHEANHGATPADRAEAQERLDKFLTTYEEALDTPTLRGQLEQGGRRIVKAYVTRNDLDRRYVLYEDPYRQHNDAEDGREKIRERTVPLPGGGGQYDLTSRLLLHPVIETNPATGAAIGTAGLTAIEAPRVHPVTGAAMPTLRDRLDRAITREGNLV